MPTLANGWAVNVERGPSCLYLRPVPPVPDASLESTNRFEAEHLTNTEFGSHNDAFLGKGFAELALDLMSQHLTFRVVVELDNVEEITAEFVDELHQLFEQVDSHAGIVRLSGLSESVRVELLRAEFGRVTDLGFSTRDEALMAGRAGRPR